MKIPSFSLKSDKIIVTTQAIKYDKLGRIKRTFVHAMTLFSNLFQNSRWELYLLEFTAWERGKKIERIFYNLEWVSDYCYSLTLHKFKSTFSLVFSFSTIKMRNFGMDSSWEYVLIYYFETYLLVELSLVSYFCLSPNYLHNSYFNFYLIMVTVSKYALTVAYAIILSPLGIMFTL